METTPIHVLGMVEFNGIASGIRATDAMVKAAPVEVVESQTIDPGRYLTVVTGDVASVEAAVNAGVAEGGAAGIRYSFVLANVHPYVIAALRGIAADLQPNAVGVIETQSAASIVEAADAACKAAPVEIARLHLALHIGGKGYAVFVGDVADVEASVAAGAKAAGDALLDRVVIPNPYEETFANLVDRDDTGESHR